MLTKTDRTKQHIVQTFFETMDEIGFEKIRVSSLAKRAGINRGTFYHHFYDKEAIIEEVEGEIMASFKVLMDKLIRMKEKNVKARKSEGRSLEETQQMFQLSCEQVMVFLYERKEVTTILAGKNGRPQFIEELGDIYCEAIRDNIEVEFPGMDYQLHYLQGFVFSGIIAMVKSWLRNGAKESPEEMARLLTISLSTAPVRIYDDDFWEQDHLLD